MKFDWFVLPFTLGLVYLLATIVLKFYQWISTLSYADKYKLKKSIFTIKSFTALKEVFLESLLHRKVFKVNALLGYMHMSLAFGWLLLILLGNLESRIFNHGAMGPPYVPIFFRFFHPNPTTFSLHVPFAYIMDFILVFVLTGVALAYYKRLNSRLLGMKKTTHHVPGDKIALLTLWCIFPLRLVAESLTSGALGGGGFLTANFGHFLNTFLPSEKLFYFFWWAYSISLGLFFVALPYSRYMHIPTEVLLIFLRNAGVKEQIIHSGFTDTELNSCSRCGICIDTCQLSNDAGISDVQSVYQLRDIRYNTQQINRSLNCLMCGRCDQTCPVGIDINAIRQMKRIEENPGLEQSYTYIKQETVHEADVIYFGGCMTHLTPSIKKSMVSIFKKVGINYWFMDEFGSICCGRPLLLAGKRDEAQKLMLKNKQLIARSGAKALVTNCPICYKMFKDEYKLNISVYHHTQYFAGLIENQAIQVMHQPINAIYHDPCELGRGCNVYNEPRYVLSQLLNLSESDSQKEKSLCCGGSLGNLTINIDQRKKITQATVTHLLANNPALMVTSCPSCKKTFQGTTDTSVIDIAELVDRNLIIKMKNLTTRHLMGEMNEILVSQENIQVNQKISSQTTS
jgi:Fe-S oxidoreductase